MRVGVEVGGTFTDLVAIDGATVHSLEHGHVSCAREDFGDPLVEACLDVAGRV